MKDNGLLKNKTNLQLIIALVLTVAFIVGIPMIVLGAVNGLTIVMVVGIVFTAVGFYVMPIMWVRYGTMHSALNVLHIIIEDGICDMHLLASNLGRSVKDVSSTVRWLLKNRYLVGVTLQGGKLEPIEKPKQKSLKCPYCGTVVTDLTVQRCPNCSGQLQQVEQQEQKK